MSALKQDLKVLIFINETFSYHTQVKTAEKGGTAENMPHDGYAGKPTGKPTAPFARERRQTWAHF